MPGVGRLDCNFGLVRLRNNGAYSIYHGLQNRFDIQDWHNLTMGASYVWSKQIDNASEVFVGGGGVNTVIPQNPFDPTVAERAEGANSFPHVANIYLSYELPWLRNQPGIIGRLIGGWNLAAAWRYQSGEAFNPFQSTANSACDTAFNNQFIGRDGCRPLLSNPAAPIDAVGRWVTVSGVNRLVNNSNCVGASGGATCPFVTANDVHWIINTNLATTITGNPFLGVPRNFLRGQTRNNLDFALGKTVNVTERVKFQLRADAFNVLNRMFFAGTSAVPGGNVNSRNINGKLTPQSFMNFGFNNRNRRQIQLMAKITF